MLEDGSKDVYAESNIRALIGREERNNRQYEGSNAYGAKAIVTSHEGKIYSAAFSNQDAFGVRKYLSLWNRSHGFTDDLLKKDAILIELPMDVEIAKNMKPHLGILAIMKLAIPHIYDRTFYNKPTLNDPNEYFVRDYFLNAKLMGLWIYDDTSGLVLIKKQPTVSALQLGY